jgi:hypothetical protein
MGYWDVVNKPQIAKRLFGGKDYDGGGTLVYGFTNLMVILCKDAQNVLSLYERTEWHMESSTFFFTTSIPELFSPFPVYRLLLYTKHN